MRVVLEPDPVDPGLCRDPDDLMLLGLVVPGRAEAFVTGDSALLVDRQYSHARIMSPRAFWEHNAHLE